MSKEFYTVLVQGCHNKGVKVTVPAVPGFEFAAPTRIIGLDRAPKQLEAFLKRVAKAGQPIPEQPEGFFVQESLMWVNAPKPMRKPKTPRTANHR